MDILRLGLGLLSIYGGVSALKKGAEHVGAGLGRTGRAGDPRARDGNGGVPTTYVKLRRGGAKTVSVGPRRSTRSGAIRTTLKTVGSLQDRLGAIAEQAEAGKRDPRVIAWSREILTKKCRPGWNGEQWCVPEKDTEAEINAIFKAMRRDVRYTSDVYGLDTYGHPRVTLDTKAEDCDGYAALGCAALMAVGIPCRFEVIQTKNSNTPDHIYISAGTPKENPKKWIHLDASVPMKPGWRAPDGMVKKRWVFEW